MSSTKLCLAYCSSVAIRTGLDTNFGLKTNSTPWTPQPLMCAYRCFLGRNLGKLTQGRKLNFPKGSIIAIDRGYTDYAWYNDLENKGVFFVTRLRKNATVRIVERRKALKGNGVTCDQTIEFAGIQTAKRCPIKLRRARKRLQIFTKTDGRSNYSSNGSNKSLR